LVIGSSDATLIAAPWLGGEVPCYVDRSEGSTEFDLGFVFWPLSPPGGRSPVGTGRIVVDKETGETTVWPSVPVGDVIARYREYRREHPRHPLTFDPLARARHDRDRAPYPDRRTELRLADGRLQTGRSMKGDAEPAPHPLVGTVLDGFAPIDRERGSIRCAEVEAVSDLLYTEDAARKVRGLPAWTLPHARDELLRGATLVTRWIREPGDPYNGRSTPQCFACDALLRHLGFTLRPPLSETESW
jgi:hypothetical protein